jgi:hypothetical protein
MTEKSLTLKEKYILLNYHPEKGRILGNTSFFNLGLAGSILLELAEKEKIKIENKRIVLLDNKTTFDAGLDVVTELMTAVNKPRRVSFWIRRISRFGFVRRLRKTLLEELISKKYLRKEEARFLFFRYYKYIAVENRSRNELIKSIRELVLHKKETDRDVVLLSILIGSTRMVNRIFVWGERRIARARIKEIAKNNEIAKGLNDAIAAIQTALITSVAVSAAASQGH